MIEHFSDSVKYLSNKFFVTSRSWYPILSVYYLTYECDFKCPYCSDGTGTPYHKLPSYNISGEKAVSILAKIKQYTNYVVITGGEPLQHPDFSYIINNVSKLGFKNVVLTTNGYRLEDFLPDIATSVHSLIFSLDTLDPQKADQWNGIGPGSFNQIIYNIQLAEKYPQKKYKIIISSVVMPYNIDDLYEIYDYCRQHNYIFAAAPQLMGVKANSLLYENGTYVDFFNFLIKEKKNNGPVYGTIQYLKFMRDLRKFQCYPFTMLVVRSDGGVYYPCLEIGKIAGNILDASNLQEIRNQGFSQFGQQPICGTQCHSACALGFGLIIKYPYSIISETYYSLKQSVINS